MSSRACKLATLRRMAARLVERTDSPRPGMAAGSLNAAWSDRKAIEWALAHPEQLVEMIAAEREAALKREIVAESVVRHAGLDD